jgi:cytochrome c553
MRKFYRRGVLALSPLAVVVAVLEAQYAPPAQPGQPSWAYGIQADFKPPAPAGTATPAPAPAADTTMHKLPGTDRSFTRAQIQDGFGPADWYPGDHPAMPEIVAKGRRIPGKPINESARACGLCHYPNGKGRAENSSVSGLPVAYFIQQMQDFRNDLRVSSEPRKGNAGLMVNIAKAMTEQDIKDAAEYFAAIKWTTPYFRVVETNTIPKMRVSNGVHFAVEGSPAATEPLGQRIVESPEHTERFELRDPRDGWIVYVPVGSIKKGEALVKTGGNGKTVACGVCHGTNLTGLGPVPAIAGRSPSMLARQMWDMKQGTRRGLWADLMKPVVQNLTSEDLVNILAYTVSRPVVGSTN